MTAYVVRDPRDAPRASGGNKDACLVGPSSEPHNSSECLSLWQLLVVQSTGERERQEIMSVYRAVERVAPLPLLAKNLEISRTIDMRAFVLSNTISRSALDDQSTYVGHAFMNKLRMCRRVSSTHREKLLRWEILKVTMIHGMHQNAVLSDTQGSGCAIHVPLRSSRALFDVTAKEDSAELDTQLRFHYDAKLKILRSQDVLKAIDDLYHELTAKGGHITRPVYYALMLVFCNFSLLHLNEETVHQLITLDFETDCKESSRLLHKLRSRRKSSFRNLVRQAILGQANLEEQASSSDMFENMRDTMEVMHRHAFQKFVVSLAFTWVESDSISEASLFVDALRKLWVSRADYFDLDFSVKYTSTSYPPPDKSLLPQVTHSMSVSDLHLASCVRYEVLKSIFLRWPMFTAGKNDVLRKWKQHASAAESSVLRVSNVEGRRQHSTRNPKREETGWSFGLTMATEPDRSSTGDGVESDEEETANIAEDFTDVNNVQSCSSFGSRKATGIVECNLSALSAQQRIQKPGRCSTISKSASDPKLTSPHQVPLYVPLAERYAQVAPTMRQIQYLSFAPIKHVQPVSLMNTDDTSLYGSRVVPSAQSHHRWPGHREDDLPSIMRHRYLDNNVDRLRQVSTNRFTLMMNEVVRDEVAAVRGRGTRLAPVLSRLRITDDTGTRPETLREQYDLGLRELSTQLIRSNGVRMRK